MRTFKQCKMEHGTINWKIKGGFSTYEIVGYATREDVDYVDSIIFSDEKHNPKAIVPIKNLEWVKIKL